MPQRLPAGGIRDDEILRPCLLERFSKPCSDTISGVPDEVATFGRGEQVERRGDQRAHLIEGARACGAEERLQFGEGEFDRIEVGAVRREKPEMGADGFEGGADLRLFVDREVIEHHDVAGSQRGHQHLFDIGEERRIVDRSVEDRRRAQPLEPQRGDDGVCLPMAAGRVVVQPDAARAAAVAAQQVGRHAAFIEKHILAYVAQWLPGLPLPPGGGDIRPALFVGVYGFC